MDTYIYVPLVRALAGGVEPGPTQQWIVPNGYTAPAPAEPVTVSHEHSPLTRGIAAAALIGTIALALVAGFWMGKSEPKGTGLTERTATVTIEELPLHNPHLARAH